MQDNNWTDDGAFYDESWADMSSRLDALGKRKKRPWLPWVALFLLLGFFAAAYFSFATEDIPEAVYADEAPTQVQGEVEKAKILVAKDQSKDMIGTTVQGGKTGNEGVQADQIRRSEARFKDLPASTPNPIQIKTSSYRTTSPPPAQVNSSNYRFDTSGDNPLSNSGTGNEKNAETLVKEIAESSASSVRPSQRVALVLNNTSPEKLKFKGILEEQLESTSLKVQESKFKALTRRRKLYLEAGATVVPNIEMSGYYVGVASLLKISNKLSIPVGLRFRKDRYTISSIDLSLTEDGESRDFSSPGVTGAENDLSNNVLADLQLSNLDNFRYQSLEFYTGLNYKIGRRLTLGGLLGATYVTQISGPRVVNPAGESLLNLTTNDRSFSLTTERDFNAGLSAESREVVVADIDVNNLIVTGELNINYAVHRRFDVSLSTRRFLSPATKKGAINIESTTFGVGLRYYLK